MRLATIALALAVSGVGVATPAHAAAGQVRIRAQDSVNGAAITTFAVNGFGRYGAQTIQPKIPVRRCGRTPP